VKSLRGVSQEKLTGIGGALLTLFGSIYIIHLWTAEEISFTDIEISVVVFFTGFLLTSLSLNKLGTKFGNKKPFDYYLRSLVVPLGFVYVGLMLIAISLLSHTLSNILLEIGLSLVLMSFLPLAYYQSKAWRAVYRLTGVIHFNFLAMAIKWITILLIIGIELKWILFPLKIDTISAVLLSNLVLFFVSGLLQLIAFSMLPSKNENPEI
jgi:uncharacterized membrane protein